MLVSDFDFNLPRDLIALKPANPRTSARLLKVSKTLDDKNISDIPEIIKSNDLLVFNDTKVIPARLFGKRGGAKVEITLHKQISGNIWKAFARPAKKLRKADIFQIAQDFSAKVLDKNEGEITLEFCVAGEEFYTKLSKYGLPPLPPYISRESGPTQEDVNNYQTIYAKNRGAVAAPTAGLHFTDDLLEKIDSRAKKVFITLHVGAGTFVPVKVDDTKDHKMHSEHCIISKEAANLINETKQSGGRVIAVGTTSLRLLEAVADKNGELKEFQGDTDIFITPGYKFKVVDALLTNFHLPKSTLFMLVSAFAGFEEMQKVYKHAIEKKYRFYSYGDACFLLKK